MAMMGAMRVPECPALQSRAGRVLRGKSQPLRELPARQAREVLVQCMALKMLTAFTLRYGACTGVLLRRDAEGGSRGCSPTPRTPGARGGAEPPAGAGALFRCGRCARSRNCERLLIVHDAIVAELSGGRACRAPAVARHSPHPAKAQSRASCGVCRRAVGCCLPAWWHQQSRACLLITGRPPARASQAGAGLCGAPAAARRPRPPAARRPEAAVLGARRHIMHAHLPGRGDDAASSAARPGLCEQTAFLLLAICIRCVSP